MFSIATRKSPLAVWQAEHIQSALAAIHPTLDVQLLPLSTRGDRILDQALSKVGGKDLFVKEIEDALLGGRAQIAVHSLKDMPTELPEGLEIVAYPKREDARDALITKQSHTLETLPRGAVVGTSSLRRAAQLLHQRPDLKIRPIRGNVGTRLKKLKEEGFDATVLAYAGLVRLGLGSLASEVLDPNVCLPAIGQGILAVEARSSDDRTKTQLAALDDRDARVMAVTERAFLHRLQGGCQVPIAGHASVTNDHVTLRGLVLSLDGKKRYEKTDSGPCEEAAMVGVRVADALLEQGARNVLDAL